MMTSPLQDGLILSAIFAALGFVGIAYYSYLPTGEELKARLPNRVSPAGFVLALVLLVIIVVTWKTDGGFARWRVFFPILFNLLIFETVFIGLLRIIKINLVALITGLLIAAGFWYWQTKFPSTLIFNITFLLAPLGAASLLIRLGYWRTRFLFVVASLWMIYDIMASIFIYPVIYRPAATTQTSFLFPAVAVGQTTLGSGDFMFLILFTLALLRDLGWRSARLHILIQSLALFITILVKPNEVQFPYLTVMTPIFFITYFIAQRKIKTGVANIIPSQK